MDTINITPAQNSFRSIALVTGVVIAIICSLVAMKSIFSAKSADATALVADQFEILNLKFDIVLVSLNALPSLPDYLNF
jgi:hypothetical protein